jgi:dihydrofolate reductase
MKIKSSVFVATSLDGFIARDDDSLDWLDDANKKIPKGEDCGFKEFFSSIDFLVLGRVTFEKVLTFSKWPYGEKKVIVLSSKPIQIPIELQKTVYNSALNPHDLVQELSARGAKKIYIDGAKTIQRFLSANLIDEITITIIPILLGKGKSLFAEIQKEIKLELISSKSFDFGFVQNKYKVKKEEF